MFYCFNIIYDLCWIKTDESMEYDVKEYIYTLMEYDIVLNVGP